MSITAHSHWEFLASSGDDLFEYSDKLMDALLDQEKCNPAFRDSAVSTDAGNQIIEIEADAEGASLSEAIAILRAAIRSALHQVGIGTPDWPKHDEVMRVILKDMHHEQLA
ncbi:MAG: hypothetical protein GEU97_22860 [Actinophytocola sp.]|nr:hypothetical protein [Actinophytocola sp.]